MTIPATGNPVHVYRPPSYTSVGAPGHIYGLTARIEKNDTGTGQVTIPLDDDLVTSVQINDVVALRRDDAGTDTTVLSFIVEQKREHTLDAEEGSRRACTLSGRGVGAFLEWALVYPAVDVTSKPVEEDAVFDWRSPRYNTALDSWGAADEIMLVETAEAGSWPHQPMAELFTLDVGAYMILDGVGTDTAAETGYYLFYRDITVTETGKYAIEVLMDDQGYMWVDGTQMLEVRAEDGFVTASFKRLELTAGTHRFCWAVFNLEDPENPGEGLGPAALAYYLFKADNQDRPLEGGDSWVSDSNTQCLFVADDPWPGMTVGEILIDLLGEADDRGAIGWIAPSFGTVNASDSAAWPRDPGITTKTGTSILQFLGELTAAGRIAQWRLSPDGETLDAYAPGYTAPVAFELEPAADPNSGELVQLDRTIT